MLKKLLILSLVVAAGICPFLPRVFADNASWKTLLADRVWDQSTFRVDRLTFPSNVSEPQKRNGVAFVSTPSNQCANLGLCDKLDVSILMNGKSQTLVGIDQQFLNPTFAMGQKGKFVYFTRSSDKTKWVDVSFIDPNTGESHPFVSLDRKANEVSFETFSTSGDRMYASLLQADAQKNVKSSLVVKSTDGLFEQRDITSMLNAPWQQVMDAYNDRMLVKFQFSGGNKQLWLINSVTQTREAIPNTWTDPNADILFAHFLSDGTVVFFENYQLYTYHPGKDTEPVIHSEAKLSWTVSPNQNVQIAGDRMTWTDTNHRLYAVDTLGVTELPVVKDQTVHLEKDAVYFADADGTWKYAFETKQKTKTLFLVMDVRDLSRVGIGADGNVWYQNTTQDTLLNIGFGSHPVMADASHVIWKGADGSIYEATLSGINTMIKSNHVFEGGFVPGQRIKAVGDARMYVIGNDGALHWIVSESVASDVYGSLWNRGITEVPPTFLWRFANGSDVTSAETIKNL